MQFHFKFLFLIILSCLSLKLHAQRVQNPKFDKKINGLISYNVPVLSVYQAHRDTSRYFFLDARELEEYEVSHIPGARYIGYDNFNIDVVSDLDKETTLVVYCSIGYRSDKIGGQLKKAGFNRVFNLYGSIFEWVNRGYIVVDKAGHPTNRLHTYDEHWSRWVDNPKIEKIY